MKREANLFEALLPIIILIVLLTLNVFIFEDSLAGPNQIALILAATVAGLIATRLGYQWETVRSKVVSTIGSAMPSILILFSAKMVFIFARMPGTLRWI